MSKEDYSDGLSSVFSDKKKFRKLTTDPTLTQLNSIQSYLRTLLNRKELDQDTYNEIRPKSTRPARAHKTFNRVPKFRPIIDTTGTAYSKIGKFLAKLLRPLTDNEFTVTDSFEAAKRIQEIPTHLFIEGYQFVSFDVESLFTNVPLECVLRVINKRVYTEKQISTTLYKSTLRKLIKDSCMKTAFSFNECLYQQTDGVSMGSPLAPVLANIIMTEVENQIITKLVQNGTIKFYIRYIDDTLILAKPSDFAEIQQQLNSFHHQLKFTMEDFPPDSEVHFLDIKFNSKLETGFFRKQTNTGQYVHFNSFEPWNMKIAWIRALITRAHKLCSNAKLLAVELDIIRRFMAWNGFPKTIGDKIIKGVTTRFRTPKDNKKGDTIPSVWLNLPYMGPYGERLVGNDTIIHMTGDGTAFNSTGKDKKAVVREEPIENATLCSGVTLGNKDDRYKSVYDAHTIVERARANIGEASFQLIEHNCEHFAMWCRYGDPISRQARIFQRVMSAIPVFGWIYLAVDALRRPTRPVFREKRNVFRECPPVSAERNKMGSGNSTERCQMESRNSRFENSTERCQMESRNSRFEISVANGSPAIIHAFKSIEQVPFCHFVNSHKSMWFYNVRGCNRIGSGDCVTFSFDVLAGTERVYISIATQSGETIAGSYEKPASDGGTIVTWGGSPINTNGESPWEDTNGKNHGLPEDDTVSGGKRGFGSQLCITASTCTLFLFRVISRVII